MNSLAMHTNSQIVTIKGKEYRMDFDPQALSIAEQIYLTRFEREVNVGVIIAELFSAKLAAVMAFAYGAMRSAGEKISWEQFSKELFTFGDYDPVFDATLSGIEALMPDVDDKNETGETDPKN